MFLDELMRVLRLSVPAERKVSLARREVEKIAIAEEELERQRIISLRNRFRGGRVNISEQNLTQFSAEERVELSTGATNRVIWDRPFTSLHITRLRPLPGDLDLPIAYIRLNGIANPLYQVRPGYIKGRFNKIWLTNTAQTGAWFNFVISNEETSEFMMSGALEELTKQVMGIKGLAAFRTLSDIYDSLDLQQKQATTSTIYNVIMLATDTEFSQVIPAATKAIRFNLMDLATFRYAWVTGKVATPAVPYMTQVANRPVELAGLS